MELSRPVAAILGAISIWPAAYFLFFIALMFSAALGQEERVGSLFPAFFVVHIVTMLVTIGLLVFYIVHLFKNEQLSGDRRVLWAIVLFMGHVIAFPVYWYLYIWKSSAPAA
jgi:hypothetical protein